MGIEVHVSDRDLLLRTRAGDAEAFGLFYRARRGDVLAFLRVRVSSSEVAADLMCETFVQALVAVHDRDRELPVVPIAWLITIARNVWIDSLRRGRVADDVRRRLQLEYAGYSGPPRVSGRLTGPRSNHATECLGEGVHLIVR